MGPSVVVGLTTVDALVGWTGPSPDSYPALPHVEAVGYWWAEPCPSMLAVVPRVS